MAINRPKRVEIVVKLRLVEVLMGQGMPRIDAVRQISVTERTYSRRIKKYRGMGIEQFKELKRLSVNWHDAHNLFDELLRLTSRYRERFA